MHLDQLLSLECKQIFQIIQTRLFGTEQENELSLISHRIGEHLECSGWGPSKYLITLISPAQ